MSQIRDVTLTSLDDLLRHPDPVGYELVDGRLVPLRQWVQASLVNGTINRWLANATKSPTIAFVFTLLGYACFPGRPDRMRRPDVSLILAERMTPELWEEEFISIRPDLAIEVIYPDDLVNDLEAKRADYRAVGVPLIWIVLSSLRKVRVIRLDGSTTVLGPDDELTGEALLPGFRCRVVDLFADPPEPSECPSASDG